MGYDIEPGTTTVYKEKFYHLIMERKLKMIFEHDDKLIGGEIDKDTKNRFILKDPILSLGKSMQELPNT